jgi:hypothetical protein
VPLTAVADAARLTLWQVRKVERDGLVSPLERRGPNGRFLVSKEDALLLLAAAFAAAAAGLALVEVVRALRYMPEVVTVPGAIRAA